MNLDGFGTVEKAGSGERVFGKGRRGKRLGSSCLSAKGKNGFLSRIQARSLFRHHLLRRETGTSVRPIPVATVRAGGFPPGFPERSGGNGRRRKAFPYERIGGWKNILYGMKVQNGRQKL